MAHEFRKSNEIKNRVRATGLALAMTETGLKRQGVDINKLLKVVPKRFEAELVEEESSSPGNSLVHHERVLVVYPPSARKR